MKIGLIYTSTTPELIELVNRELRREVGPEAEFINYSDPSILSDIQKSGYVSSAPAARLVSLFMQAVQDGADVILNICSSVGETADSVQPLAQYLGVPVIRIDEDMCRAAILAGPRIGVLATLPTTLLPTKNTLQRTARALNRKVTLVDGLIEGAFGASQEQFRKLLFTKSRQLMDDVDVILLCQGSMAYCEEYLHEQCQIPVFSSPRFGAAAVKRALEAKGLL